MFESRWLEGGLKFDTKNTMCPFGDQRSYELSSDNFRYSGFLLMFPSTDDSDANRILSDEVSVRAR